MEESRRHGDFALAGAVRARDRLALFGVAGTPVLADPRAPAAGRRRRCRFRNGALPGQVSIRREVFGLLREMEIYVDHRPHLYTLALVNQQFPRYAAVVADTDSARLFVFGLRSTISEDRVDSTKMSRTQTGGDQGAARQRAGPA